MGKQALRSHLAIGFLFLMVFPHAMDAQNKDSELFSFEFKGEPLAEVLQTVARETGMDMVYDPQIVEGIYVYNRIQNQPAPDLLKSVLKESPLDFVILSSGTVVIVQPVRGSPAYGSYYGKVVDRQTGEPLPGTSVMLADASGGTSAGPSGSFSLNQLMSGSYKIIFSYVGYEPVYKTITIEPNQNHHEKIALTPKPVAFTPVLVTGHQPQIPTDGGHNPSISSNTEWEPAGRMQDAIRSLNLFSGVQYGLPMTDLHVQGGRQGEHRIMLDGVPVYNPYSFGQMFSAFSPYAINKIELHKAGYGVAKGSQIAGLIDLKQDVNSINRSRAIFQADPLSVNLRGDLYFPNIHSDENSSLKIMAAGRSNYWNIYQEPNLNRTLIEWDNLDPLITSFLLDSNEDPSLYQPQEHNSDVRFYDVHLASSYEINSYNTISSSFYLGENFVNTDLLRQAPEQEELPEYLYANDEYQWNNFMGRLTYDLQISPRFDISTQVSFSSNELHHRYLIGTSNNPVIPETDGAAQDVYASFQLAGTQNSIPNQLSNNSIKHFIVKNDGSYHFSPQFNLDAGLQLDVVNSLVDLSDLFYLPTESRQKSTFVSSYLNGNWRLGNYWKFNVGNRLTYINSSNRLYTEPRASIQYDHAATGEGIGYWSAQIAGGLYRQFINQFEITNPGPTSLVPSLSIWSHAGSTEKPKAWHLSGSFRLKPSENTTLDVEGFYKWQPNTYTVSYNNLLEGSAVNRSSFQAFAETTEMTTLGAGVRLHQSLAASKLQLMLGYDYSFNRINLDTQFGRTLPTPWNEPHRFQIRSLWRVLPELTAVAKWQSIYGRAWGFRQAYYNFLLFQGQTEAGGFSFTSPEDDKLSPFHQLDVSLIYEPSLDFMDLKARIDLVNLFDRQNTIDWSLRPTGSDSQYEIRGRNMPGFNPTLSIQIGI